MPNSDPVVFSSWQKSQIRAFPSVQFTLCSFGFLFWHPERNPVVRPAVVVRLPQGSTWPPLRCFSARRVTKEWLVQLSQPSGKSIISKLCFYPVPVLSEAERNPNITKQFRIKGFAHSFLRFESATFYWPTLNISTARTIQYISLTWWKVLSGGWNSPQILNILKRNSVARLFFVCLFVLWHVKLILAERVTCSALVSLEHHFEKCVYRPRCIWTFRRVSNFFWKTCAVMPEMVLVLFSANVQPMLKPLISSR